MDRAQPNSEPNTGFQVLSDDGELVLCRRWRSAGDRHPVLAVYPAAEHPRPAVLDRLAQEYALKDVLDSAWAAPPLELVHEGGRQLLLLEDPGGQPLERLLAGPMETGTFLRLAVAIAAALGKVHQRGLVHREIKPANILADPATGQVRLTGFGIASRLPRQWQSPEPPESIAGTLAYMAPEQTGRMNRSIDSRSDLYALGVTLYQMLTGALPFAAADPMEWVHAHTARRALPPGERLQGVPVVVSAIIMKLLAKTPEERYQTAAGVEHDLRRCLEEWEERGRIEAFALAARDISDRLLVPERLYGRSREIKRLLAAFARVAESGTPELVLVSGYSGIGKSSVIHELHKALVPVEGLFGSGKFDLHQRDTPYTTLAQALQGLIRPLLGKSEEALQPWREALRAALGANVRLMLDLVPELKLIVGEEPAVAELPWQDAQRRFQMVFRRFIGVFARPEHPLVLFFDDMQWLDTATLDLLTDLLTHPDVRHLMLIGAFRSNEVDAAHPLHRALEAIRAARASIEEIVLAPLDLGELQQLVVDCLRCEAQQAAPLAQLVRERTGGNPFFAIQFLRTLAEKQLLRFNYEQARWSWDLQRIQGEAYADSVVELIVGRLNRLPVDTQHSVRCLACLGWVADAGTLAIAAGTSEQEVRSQLQDASRLELIVHLDGRYKFLHDRIQEVAYSLIPESERAGEHLRIGRLLDAHVAAERREEAIFEIVNQLNRGAALIGPSEEREHLAALNLAAAGRARAASAYASALSYLTAGAAILHVDSWERLHELAFTLELQRAECEFLTGDRISAEQRLALLAERAIGSGEQAAVACLRIDLLMTLGRSERSVEVGLDYLRSVGVAWLPHPARDEMRQEFERISQQLGSRPIHALIDLPFMQDPGWQAQMDVWTALLPAALFTDENLFCLMVARMANVSMEHGNTHGSCLAYVWLGLLLGPHFDNYPAAFQFGQLGLDLVEKRGLTRFRARVYLDFSHVVNPWMQHTRSGPELVRRALNAANEIGDLTFAAYSSCNLVSALLAAGGPLADVQQEAERQLEFARQLHFGLIVDIITGQLRLIMALRGLTPRLASFDGPEFAEPQFEHRLDRDPGLTVAIGWYWVRKLQGRVFAGDEAGAMAAAAKVEPFLWTIPSHLEIADYYFYAALARAASYESAPAQDQPALLHTLRGHHAQLETWARNCPENFEDRAAVVGAEIARLEGRELDAMRLYEQAIHSARANGFVHNEALANEVAARFYAVRGFETNSHAHLRNARRCYLSWGADAKVRQLDQLHPHLREEERAADPTGMIGAPVEHLDLATVIKVSQAISGEIVLEKLLDTLLRTAIAQAGAERGLLIRLRGDEPRVAAEATTSGDAVVVHMRDTPVAAIPLPESILHYVVRTRESVILDDAPAENPFSADPYIRQHHARSVLCLPLLNQAKLIGALYLENTLAPGVFAPGRITVLKLLASQAAISLENTGLYRDLAEREAKIRRLIDANIVGIFIWDFDGRILEANDAFLEMVGYDREDLVAGRIRWADLTPPEWHERDAATIREHKKTGRVRPFEKEYFRKDGSRVPVLLGAATFEEGGSQGVAFVLDLTERKRASEALGEAQAALARVNRVTTLGVLAASIAHEVNQPLGAMVTSAASCSRWLAAQPPDFDKAQRALERIAKDGVRASEVIARIRLLVKRQPPRNDGIDINAAILEVIALTRDEVSGNEIALTTSLADKLPLVEGDRIQIQQVILNLIVNAIEAMGPVGDRSRSLSIVSSRDPAGGVRVEVRDSGTGIDPAEMERLFEAFYTTKAEGLGMGLSISRSIIEAHGGQLGATANEPHGAVFQFSLPIERPASHPGRAEGS